MFTGRRYLIAAVVCLAAVLVSETAFADRGGVQATSVSVTIGKKKGRSPDPVLKGRVPDRSWQDTVTYLGSDPGVRGPFRDKDKSSGAKAAELEREVADVGARRDADTRKAESDIEKVFNISK